MNEYINKKVESKLRTKAKENVKLLLEVGLMDYVEHIGDHYYMSLTRVSEDFHSLFPDKYIVVTPANVSEVAKVVMAKHHLNGCFELLKQDVSRLQKHCPSKSGIEDSFVDQITLKDLKAILYSIASTQYLISELADVTAEVEVFNHESCKEGFWKDNKVKVVDFYGDNFISLYVNKIDPKFKEKLHLFGLDPNKVKSDWIAKDMSLFTLEL